MTGERMLSPAQTRRYYDRLGALLDSQSFYEQPALDDLARHIEWERCRSVWEFGCGTARFAQQLLETHLPSSAIYTGIDISPKMVALAKARLAHFGDHANVRLSDGAMRFSAPDETIDAVICTYVLDLLPDEEIITFLSEAYRVLAAGGQLGLVSLTRGKTLPARLVSAAWMGLHRLSPWIVGGCRPITLASRLDRVRWDVHYRNTVKPVWLVSEVIVAVKRKPG